MARKAKAKSKAESPAKTAKPEIDESALTKGQLRKLNALRKSIGVELAEEALSKWLKRQHAAKDSESEDKSATLIAETLLKLIDEGKLRIPRGGYVVRRGRGRVVVTRAKSE